MELSNGDTKGASVNHSPETENSWHYGSPHKSDVPPPEMGVAGTHKSTMPIRTTTAAQNGVATNNFHNINDQVTNTPKNRIFNTTGQPTSTTSQSQSQSSSYSSNNNLTTVTVSQDSGASGIAEVGMMYLFMIGIIWFVIVILCVYITYRGAKFLFNLLDGKKTKTET